MIAFSHSVYVLVVMDTIVNRYKATVVVTMVLSFLITIFFPGKSCRLYRISPNDWRGLFSQHGGAFFHFGVRGVFDWRCGFHDWQEEKITMAPVISS